MEVVELAPALVLQVAVVIGLLERLLVVAELGSQVLAVLVVVVALAVRRKLLLSVGLCLQIFPRIGHHSHIQSLAVLTATSVYRLERVGLELLSPLQSLTLHLAHGRPLLPPRDPTSFVDRYQPPRRYDRWWLILRLPAQSVEVVRYRPR